MKRPFADKRPLGPFAQIEGNPTDPDFYIVFNFEPEDWIIDADNRDMHRSRLQSKLNKPAGPIGEPIIRVMEKQWDGQELVKEYEDELPVTMVQIPMTELITRQSEANKKVISIASDYIDSQGGEFEEVYSTE